MHILGLYSDNPYLILTTSMKNIFSHLPLSSSGAGQVNPNLLLHDAIER